jgi:hypothetical protein
MARAKLAGHCQLCSSRGPPRDGRQTGRDHRIRLLAERLGGLAQSRRQLSMPLFQPVKAPNLPWWHLPPSIHDGNWKLPMISGCWFDSEAGPGYQNQLVEPHVSRLARNAQHSPTLRLTRSTHRKQAGFDNPVPLPNQTSTRCSEAQRRATS